MNKAFLTPTLILSCGLLGTALGQNTLEVGDGKTFTTIQAAIDTAVDNDIVVIDPGVYEGAILINEKSLTVRGAVPNDRPVLALQAHGSLPDAGSNTTGFVISGDNITVNVSDLIAIPATSNAPIRAFQTTNNTNLETITVNFENILITGNDGSNNPSVTDAFDNTTPLGTGFSNDGMYLVNRAFAATLRNGVGKYSLTDVVVIGAGRDGIVIYVTGVADPQAANAAEAFATLSGCAIARTVRNFIQWGNGNDGTGIYTITGSREYPGLIAVNNGTGTEANAPSGIVVNGVNGTGEVVVDHLVFANNSHPFYVNLTTTNNPSVTISDSLFANITSNDALALSGAGTGEISVTGSTFFNNGVVSENTAGLWLNATAAPSVSVSENIFAGAGRGGIIISTGAGANVTIDGNGLVAQGPHALGSAVFGAGAADATVENTLSTNPMFVSTSVGSLAALQVSFDVNSEDYEDLTGWGEFVLLTQATGWNLYE